MGFKDHDILLSVFISHAVPSQCINKLSEGKVLCLFPRPLVNFITVLSLSNVLRIVVRLSQISLNYVFIYIF